jgi:hypothetical protein
LTPRSRQSTAYPGSVKLKVSLFPPGTLKEARH